jgi:hypothetical protein
MAIIGKLMSVARPRMGINPIVRPAIPRPRPVPARIPGPLPRQVPEVVVEDPIFRSMPMGPGIPFIPPPAPPREPVIETPVQPIPVMPPAQPLPIFGPGDLDLGIKEDAPDIRDFAIQLPGGGTIYDDPVVRNMQMGKGIPFTPPPTPVSDVALGVTPPVNIGGPALDTPLIPEKEILERPIIPPRPDDFMSIERLGADQDIAQLPTTESLTGGLPRQTLSPDPIDTTPLAPITERPTPPMSIGGPGGGQTDPRVFTGGSATFDERGETFVPPTTVAPTPDPVVEPTPTPTLDPVATTTGDPATPSPTETIPTPPGSVDPVIMSQIADERISDPLLRALYFGTPDQPGFYNQLQQVGANLLGAQAPGTEYDPSMTEKFFNPFEDRVVQQTIEDVLKAGEQRDIAQRAQDIGRGGLSAFGSRARLTASERQEDLGRGLAKQLANIRQSGFSEAQRTGLSEFDRQYGRDLSQLYRPLEVLRGIGGLLPGYQAAGTQLRTTYGMPQDPSALGLGAALSAYSSLAPQTGSVFDNYGQTTGQG